MNARRGFFARLISLVVAAIVKPLPPAWWFTTGKRTTYQADLKLEPVCDVSVKFAHGIEAVTWDITNRIKLELFQMNQNTIAEMERRVQMHRLATSVRDGEPR